MGIAEAGRSLAAAEEGVTAGPRAVNGAEPGRGGLDELALLAARPAAGVCLPFMDGVGAAAAAMGVGMVVEGEARVAGFAAGRSRGVACPAAGVTGVAAAGRGMWLCRALCGVAATGVLAAAATLAATGGFIRKLGSGWSACVAELELAAGGGVACCGAGEGAGAGSAAGLAAGADAAAGAGVDAAGAAGGAEGAGAAAAAGAGAAGAGAAGAAAAAGWLAAPACARSAAGDCVFPGDIRV